MAPFDNWLTKFLIFFFQSFCFLWRINLQSFSKKYLFKKDFIYLCLDRGQGREKDWERNINVWLPLTHPLLGMWPATQICALTGYRTGDPLVCRSALYPLSYTSQGEILSNFKLKNKFCWGPNILKLDIDSISIQ